MSDLAPKIRLYVDAPLLEGTEIGLSGQAHYLTGVMRQGIGDRIALFNGRDGAWRARITEAGKRRVTALAETQIAPQGAPPDLWLCFAPIKKARTDFIVEKATELGCARILPVLTRFTNAERVRTDRLRAHCIEAAEQCGGTYVPDVAEPQKLDKLLDGWSGARRLMFCDESRSAAPVLPALQGAARGAWAILIGPEGGFAPEEAERLRTMPGVMPVTLGPRILRADTAAAAAITARQAVLGDWT